MALTHFSRELSREALIVEEGSGDLGIPCIYKFVHPVSSKFLAVAEARTMRQDICITLILCHLAKLSR